MGAEKDYYETLGVQKGASADEIRKSYKELAKKYHPDISKEKDAEKKFKEIQQAYSVLGDEQKRKNYDQFGEAGEKFSGFSGFDFGGFSNREFDFGEMFGENGFSGFSDIFGGGFGGHREPSRGEDLAVRLNVTFEEAAFGAEKDIEIQRIAECEKCNGSGAEPGSRIIKCPKCNGTGTERSVRKTFLGTIATQTTCRKCKGMGETPEKACSNCSGSGRARERKKITVKIPEGINTGNNLRMRGMGNAGERGAGYGDLIAVIYVESHEVFKRDGSDIYLEIPISFSEAALGTETEIPTLKGTASLKIPGGTQTGTVFRMKDKGIKELGKERYGDQFVKVILKTPEKLSKEEREIFEKLEKKEGLSKNRESIIDRLKKKFK